MPSMPFGVTTVRIQYGVQILWISPEKAGVVDGDSTYPGWAVFDTPEQQDSFASLYERQMEAGDHNNVRAVYRRQRAAFEAFGEWV